MADDDGARRARLELRHLARRAGRAHHIVERLAGGAAIAIADALLAEDAPPARHVVASATAALQPLWSAP